VAPQFQIFLLKGGEFFMSDIQKTLALMGAKFNVVLSCTRKRSKRGVWSELKRPVTHKDEINRKNKGPPAMSPGTESTLRTWTGGWDVIVSECIGCIFHTFPGIPNTVT
jgi:hypothetical protein